MRYLIARGYYIITGLPLRGIVSTTCVRFACGKMAKTLCFWWYFGGKTTVVGAQGKRKGLL